MQNKASFTRELLIAPNDAKRVLLHSCCAPCSCAIMEALVVSGIELTVFYYNPNVHPREEYEIRKNENKRYAEKLGVPFVDADYDTDNWFARVKGLEDEPERGRRCTACFALRMERTALYAKENGFDVFATSLGISRLKNQEQVYACGHAAAAKHEGLVFWDYNWRAKGGADRGAALAKQEEFYRQNYCGCVFSKRAREAKSQQKD